MKKLALVVGAAALLAGCATSQSVAQAEARHVACRNVDPPVGSNLVRRSDCGLPSASDADAARRDIQASQQGQNLQTNPAKQ